MSMINKKDDNNCHNNITTKMIMIVFVSIMIIKVMKIIDLMKGVKA
jgi:hypothetical protein